MDAVALRGQLAACHEDAFAWAVHCCGRDRQAAEEVLQASYLKVLDGRAQWGGRSAFRTWLFGVIRVSAAEQRRRSLLRALRILPLEPAHEPPSAEPAPDARLESAERVERLTAALARLGERQRDVLVLVFYHGHTVESAAEVLGIGVGSARTHYARGKANLRKHLEAAGWTG